MPVGTAALYLLAFNAAWDFVTGAGLLMHVATGSFQCLADKHLCLWISDQHKTDPVLSSLTGLVVIQWGVSRAFAAADISSRWQDATSTYIIEGLAIGAGALAGKLHGFPSMLVLAMCLACAALTAAAGLNI